MKKSRLVALLLSLVMLLVLVAGCTQAPTPKSGENPDEKPAQESSGDKVKLKLYLANQDDDSDIVKQRSQFQNSHIEARFPEYEFEWTKMAPGTDYRQQYDKLLMAGDGPTLWHQLPFVDVQTRMRNGTIAEITDYVVNWDLRNEGKVNPSIEPALQSDDGKWYAVPYNPYIFGMVYSTTAIKAGGGDPAFVPETWEEFSTMTKTITNKENAYFGYALLGSDFCAWPLTPWVWSAGGEMVVKNSDGTYAVGFNQPAGVDAVMYMHQLVHKDQVTQTDLLESYTDYMNNLLTGQIGYGWNMPTALDKEKLATYGEVQENYGVIPIPGKTAEDKVAFAGGEVWTMHPKATKEQMDASWEVLNYITYDEEYLRSYWQLEDELGLLTPNPSARQDLVEVKYSYATTWPEHWKAEFAALNAVAKPEPFCANWNSLKDYLVDPFQKIIANPDCTREEAQALLDECAQALYTDFPESYKAPN